MNELHSYLNFPRLKPIKVSFRTLSIDVESIRRSTAQFPDGHHILFKARSSFIFGVSRDPDSHVNWYVRLKRGYLTCAQLSSTVSSNHISRAFVHSNAYNLSYKFREQLQKESTNSITILYYLLLHHSILGSVQVVYWFYSFIQLNNFDLINLLLINFNYLIELLIINN